MTTPTGSEPVITSPVTARIFLYGEDSVPQLTQRLQGLDLGSASGALGSTAGKLLDESIAPIAAGFLDVDLGAVLAAGWRISEQLTSAARETLAAPGSTSIVDVASHRVESTWQPRIDVVLGSRSVAHLAGRLTVAFELTGLCATVSAGRLTRVGGGRCRVVVTFAIGGRTLGERTAQFDPQLGLPLGEGIALSTEPEPAPAAEVVTLPDRTPAGTPTAEPAPALHGAATP